MIIEFPQTNQICRVHWGHSLKRINAKAECLKTIEEKIVFLKTVIKALTMNNIFGVDYFVEAPGFYDDQTQDSVKNYIQEEINDLRQQSNLSPINEIIERKQIDIDVVKSLFEKLKGYFAPYDYDSFLYVINGGEKPSGFTGLTWLRSKALLAYFVDKLHCELIKKDPKERIQWKSFENDFQVTKLRVTRRDSTKWDYHPKGHEEIDAMF